MTVSRRRSIPVVVKRLELGRNRLLSHRIVRLVVARLVVVRLVALAEGVVVHLHKRRIG